MSLLRRFSRALETLSRPHLDERSLFGAQGEASVSQLLDGPAILSRVMNPIIPPYNGRTYALESDFLVYTQGNLFCIEIKRYKGRISYVSGVPNAQYTPALLQEKTGKYGERFAPTTHPNPLKKTRTFIWHLKNYLAEQVDARFRKVFIIPVVAFGEEADICAIHSLEDGMIAVSELPTFFERHRNLKYTRNPSHWIMKGMQQVPTSDLVLTTDHHPFKGFLAGNDFVFDTRDGGTQCFPYARIRSIRLHHIWLFSDYDPMTIFFTDGPFQEFECIGGIVQMTDLSDKPHQHRLRNVEKIVIGRANKRVRLS
jgi:hypothetical protein